MRETSKLLLVVAPTALQCHATAKEFGLDFGKSEQMRFISNPYLLRGWSRGTPFVALDRSLWPKDLDLVLHALTVKGQLRIANDLDLAELQHEPLFVSPPCVSYSVRARGVRA